MHGRDRARDVGALLLGAILLAVGVTSLLRSPLGFDPGELDGAEIWPVIVVVIGGSIVLRALDRSSIHQRHP